MTVTPAMRQYHQIKKKHEGCIVLFQLGDFYEALYDDAKIMAKELDIVLTARKKREGKVPMAGIPVHALDKYLPRLVEKGYKVAVAAQTQSASETKGVVKREVIRIVTPGTLTDGSKIKTKSNRYIASVSTSRPSRDTKYAIAFADTSTGEFKVTKELNNDQAKQALSSISPKEIVLEEGKAKKSDGLLQPLQGFVHITKLDEYTFDAEIAETTLTEHFNVDRLKGFGIGKEDKLSVSAAGALLQYLASTQKTSLEHITTLAIHEIGAGLTLDQITIRNLELVEPLFSRDGPSLLSTIDRTKTPMGARLLRHWVLHPLADHKKINERLAAVGFLKENSRKIENLEGLLEEVSDIERIVGRFGLRSIRPPHLPALRQSIQNAVEIAKLLKSVKIGVQKKPTRLLELTKRITANEKKVRKLIAEIEKAILDEPAAVLHTGNIFKKGYDKDLDELQNAAAKGKKWIQELEAREKKNTKIHSLKVRYNKVFGYYIEVSKANMAKVPEDYIRKQTLVNAERFITPELKEMEAKVLGAQDRMIKMEDDLFEKLVEKCRKHIQPFQEIAQATGEIDVLLGFASLADDKHYTRPEVTNSAEIDVKKGRHPVVEEITEASGEMFVPNETALGGGTNQIVILTGPNMSGKSTYIRQVALITLMAQIGCFVPAAQAKIGVVDRIFARVGASDNLALGESTFMVEMLEAANILHHASSRSLVILDEVGRGTSTYDGMSIAWAIVEYLHEKIGCKTLFATHYHELTDLEQLLKRVKNYHVIAKDDGEKIVFLRKIKKGRADRSYGVHVAKLAGVPEPVVKRAWEILEGFEKENSRSTQLNLPLEFTQTDKSKDLESEKVKGLLADVDIDDITPREALGILSEISNTLKKGQTKK